MKFPCLLLIQPGKSAWCSLKWGFLLSIIHSTISAESFVANFCSFHPPMVVISLTSTSYSMAISLSIYKRAPNFVQLSNKNLEFSTFIYHHILCFTSSLIIIICLQTCNETPPVVIVGCNFLQYLYHIYPLHKEQINFLKFQQSFANKALDILCRPET